MPIQLFTSKSLYHSRIEITEPGMTSFHQICFCDFNKGSRKYINWKLFTMVNIKLMIFNKGRITWTNPSGRSHSERAVHSLEWPYGWTEYHYKLYKIQTFQAKKNIFFPVLSVTNNRTKSWAFSASFVITRQWCDKKLKSRKRKFDWFSMMSWVLT